jgi:hypothetical protein
VIVVDRGDAETECFAHVLGETYRMSTRLDACGATAGAGWFVYVRQGPGKPLHVHLYFGDVARLLRHAVRRSASGARVPQCGSQPLRLE